MVDADNLQKPSTDTSKIIVAIGIGLFSLLILNIFDLLSFWTLVAVLVGVAMVLKFGVPSIGTVATLVVIVVILALVGSVLSPVGEMIFGKHRFVFDAGPDQWLGGWEASEGADARGGCFVLSPGASITKKFKGTTIGVSLIGPEGNGPMKISVKDMYDFEGNFERSLPRDAEFDFFVREGMVNSYNKVKFGSSLSLMELKRTKSIKRKKNTANYIGVAVAEKTVQICYSSSKEEHSCYFKTLPEGYWSRNKEREYKLIIKNLSNNKISIDDIIVTTEPAAIYF